MAALEGLRAGPPTLLHADWKASNLHWTDGGLLVLDWEFAHSGEARNTSAPNVRSRIATATHARKHARPLPARSWPRVTGAIRSRSSVPAVRSWTIEIANPAAKGARRKAKR